jgi:acylphosphatase
MTPRRISAADTEACWDGGMTGDIVRRRVLVRGHVQGVFFRASAEREAARFRVAGWARNLRDGRVELVVEGPADAVDAMVAWARLGPPRARVDALDVEDETPEGVTGFRAR